MILSPNQQAKYLAHKSVFFSAVLAVMNRGWYVLDEEVEAFEAEFASYFWCDP